MSEISRQFVKGEPLFNFGERIVGGHLEERVYPRFETEERKHKPINWRRRLMLIIFSPVFVIAKLCYWLAREIKHQNEVTLPRETSQASASGRAR